MSACGSSLTGEFQTACLSTLIDHPRKVYLAGIVLRSKRAIAATVRAGTLAGRPPTSSQRTASSKHTRMAVVVNELEPARC